MSDIICSSDAASAVSLPHTTSHGPPQRFREEASIPRLLQTCCSREDATARNTLTGPDSAPDCLATRRALSSCEATTGAIHVKRVLRPDMHGDAL